MAIGDHIVDLGAAAATGAFADESDAAARARRGDTRNALMASGPTAWSALRFALSRALREGSTAEARLARCLVEQSTAEYAVPARIGDYTDFYTSVHHATNIGR